MPRRKAAAFFLRESHSQEAQLILSVNVVTETWTEPYVFFTPPRPKVVSNHDHRPFPLWVCPTPARSKDMITETSQPFDLMGLLARLQIRRVVKAESEDAEASYRELLRYAVQIAVERQVAADVLSELRELLSKYEPYWYSADQHKRVESTLELLQRL